MLKESVLKKSIITLMLLSLLLAFIAVPVALAIVSQSREYYVTDDANVLTDETRRFISNSNADLEHMCEGAQIVIVTVEYLDGMYADEYATLLFNEWGVGNQDANNGMLLLLATAELRGGLVVGQGIIGSWDNDTINLYLDTHFWPEVDNGNYDAAVRNICEELFSWYADYYGVAQQDVSGGSEYIPPADEWYNQPEEYTGGYYAMYYDPINYIMPFLVIGIIVIIVIVLAASSDRRGYRAYHMHMGIPMPRYHWWFMLGHRPYRGWCRNHWHGPRGPRGPGGFGGPRGPGGFGGPRGPGGFGGRSGRPPGSGGGFGGFGGGGRSGGGFGGFGGGGGRGSGGGGGGFSGGFGGRR